VRLNPATGGTVEAMAKLRVAQHDVAFFLEDPVHPLRRSNPCVYDVCMARVNVYLPDELADRARAAGVNISGVTQNALRNALYGMDTDRWLDRLDQTPRTSVPHERVIRALDDARDELGA
jgi:post-segregation antitoxin (ccd killing protein)